VSPAQAPVIEDIRASEEAGFRAHLTKPVTFDVLLATIRRVSA
jgi:hypothetical protein